MYEDCAMVCIFYLLAEISSEVKDEDIESVEDDCVMGENRGETSDKSRKGNWVNCNCCHTQCGNAQIGH